MLSQNSPVIQIDRFKKQLLQTDMPGLTDLLDTDSICNIINNAVEEIPHNVRERIWTPTVTLSAFIRQILTKGSCSDAVKSVQADQIRVGEEPCSSNTSAYCQARKQLPEKMLSDLVKYTGKQLEDQSRQHWNWRGRTVILADGSTLTMADTEANQNIYPQESNQKEGPGFPILRIEAITSLNSGGVLDFDVAPYSGKGTGEATLLRGILSNNIQKGGILLADRYYESFWFESSLVQSEADLLCPVGGNRKVNREEGTALNGDRYDRIFELKKPARPDWMSTETYNSIPKSIEIRIFRIYGKTYTTTMLDSKKYRKNALRKLYQQRWHIEVDLRFIKCVMDMEPLCCKTPDMVRKEIAATLLAYNLIRLLMLQAGIKHHVWPRYISFTEAWGTFRAFAQDLAGAAGEKFVAMGEKVLKITASKLIGKRKGRVEPRALKRRHSKRYPYLNKPRKEIKAEIIEGQNSCHSDICQNEGNAKCVPT